MKDWIEGFQASVDYIEQNLTKDPADTVSYICIPLKKV